MNYAAIAGVLLSATMLIDHIGETSTALEIVLSKEYHECNSQHGCSVTGIDHEVFLTGNVHFRTDYPEIYNSITIGDKFIVHRSSLFGSLKFIQRPGNEKALKPTFHAIDNFIGKVFWWTLQVLLNIPVVIWAYAIHQRWRDLLRS